MKIYFINKQTQQKTYLPFQASTRTELAQKARWLYGYFSYNGLTYSINDTKAETSAAEPVAGIIIGGLFGLLIGPEGAFVGAAIGGGITGKEYYEDKKLVDVFNNSIFQQQYVA